MADKQDKYANSMYTAVVESAANTLTFAEMTVGLNIFDKVGLLINRIEWFDHLNLLVAADDRIDFGIAASNQFVAVGPSVTSIIFYHRVTLKGIGAPANALMEDIPLVDDFSTMPGGGILVAPKPLYLFTKGTALASASEVEARLFFTVIKMRPEDYFELLESRSFFG